MSTGKWCFKQTTNLLSLGTHVCRHLIISSRDCREADSRDTSPRHACLGEVSRKIWLHDFAINNNGGSVPVIFISLLRTICHKFLRSGGETSLNCLKFPQIRPSLREYSTGLKTCENSRKRTRLLLKKTHSQNESEKSSPKKAKIESITKVIFREVVRPSI